MESGKPFVFVLMPFNSDFEELYESAIYPACDEVGIRCQRADKVNLVGNQNIMEMVNNMIARSDIIISILSGKNPNVYYETGYAHALGKNVILLIDDGKDIPFDMSQYKIFIYGEMKYFELKRELANRIKWCIENPDGHVAQNEFNFKLYLSGADLDKNPTIKVNWTNISNQEKAIKLQIGIHNPQGVFRKGNFNIGLITPAEFDQNHFTGEIIHLPDGKLLHFPEKNIGSIYPYGWASITLHLDSTEPLIGYEGGEFQIIARVFTEIGTKDYSFNILLEPYQRIE
ncbi:MAG TPA: hypothetical protein VHY08_27870 [Bacillota bacterium]|nr:hypothetical protein [Bacillota bacterium]